MNWPALMALGLGALRLPPDVFWSMTPREFSIALRGATGATIMPAPLDREGFNALATRFPDEGAPP